MASAVARPSMKLVVVCRSCYAKGKKRKKSIFWWLGTKKRSGMAFLIPKNTGTRGLKTYNDGRKSWVGLVRSKAAILISLFARVTTLTSCDAEPQWSPYLCVAGLGQSVPLLKTKLIGSVSCCLEA
jgi:hypothetical protein